MFNKINYSELSPKQKEIYNFQKISAYLADYGFNCIKLSDDWNGADFLAYHANGKDTLRIQLKSRITIDKKYMNKELHIAFPIDNGWCLIDHDNLIKYVQESTNWLESTSWTENGKYHSATLNSKLSNLLKPFFLVN